ncbi:MAG: 50S ribosomal protein L4 [Lentisphaeria bacterium]
MATLSIVDDSGSAVGDFEVDDAWLERKKGAQAVHDVVVAYQAAGRAGTACTKTRGQVTASTAKPWRQKGTGRARSGRSSSPIWRGGGTVFGPVSRSYAKTVNRKVKHLALRRVLAGRIDEEAVIVVDDAPIDEPRTKKVLAWLSGIGAGEHALVIVDDENYNLFMGARNLPAVLVVRPGAVTAYDLLHYDRVVISKDAFTTFGARIS